MMELADTSAWGSRQRLSPEQRAELKRRIEGGEVATCAAVKHELLYSARNLEDFRERRAVIGALPHCPIGREEWERALDVYELLAARGGAHQREVPFNDLLVAAAAEAAGLPVLHYDRHFERIAEVTGQPVRAIAPLGSL